MSDRDQFANILNEIGLLLSEDVRGDPENSFLYAEGDPGVMTASIFLNQADRILYRDPSDDIVDALLDLWRTADADKKWGTMIYTIKDGRFDAQFDYPDPAVWAQREDDSSSKRIAAVTAHFGDKPIDFSDP